jgi:hypothetical protein
MPKKIDYMALLLLWRLTLAYVRAWSKKYKDAGLVVIGCIGFPDPG